MTDPFFTNSDFPQSSLGDLPSRHTDPLSAAEQAQIKLLLDLEEQKNRAHRAGSKKWRKTLKYMFISWTTLGSFELFGVPYAGYGSLAIGFLYGITRPVNHVE